MFKKKIKGFRKHMQLLNEALKFHQTGDYEKAINLYRQIIDQEPGHIEAQYLLANIFLHKGNFNDARTILQHVIELDPAYAEAHNSIGNVEFALNEFSASISSFKNAIVLQPQFYLAWYNLGNSFTMTGNTAEAITCLKKALSIKPDFLEAHINLGLLYQRSDEFENALSCFLKANAIAPNEINVILHIIGHYFDRKFYDNAWEWVNRAMKISPESSEVLFWFGNLLTELWKIDDAIEAYRKTLQINPNFDKALTNLGHALRRSLRTNDAIDCYREVIRRKPDNPDAHYNLAIALLEKGDYIEGWKEYEYRWQKDLFKPLRKNFARPLWNGKHLIIETLLLYSEQGLGDSLQFIRYLPLARERAANVIFECEQKLFSLFSESFHCVQFIRAGNSLPPYDFQCPLLSLPHLFSTSLETIPLNIPYLQIPEMIRLKWQNIVAPNHTKLNVGICWAGSPTHKDNRHRSMPLEFFEPLSTIKLISLFSLQKGPASQEIRSMHWRDKIYDYTDFEIDFSDTAALVHSMDIVISVDTSIAHLAGAINKPMWLLLPYAPDFRWLLGRDDSPWYPSMRLFRQENPGDWKNVIDRVVAAIAERSAF